MHPHLKFFFSTHKKWFAICAGVFVVAAACTAGGFALANRTIIESAALTPVTLFQDSSTAADLLQTTLSKQGIVIAEDDHCELITQENGGMKGIITHSDGTKTEISVAPDGVITIDTIPAFSDSSSNEQETTASSSASISQSMPSHSEKYSSSSFPVTSSSGSSSFIKEEDEYDPNAPLDADYIEEHVVYQVSHFMVYAPDEWKKAFEAGVLTQEQYDTLCETHGEMLCYTEEWALKDLTVEFPVNGYANIFRELSNSGYTQFDFTYQPFQKEGEEYIRFLFYYQ